jgi:hypothetical protein
MGTFDWIKYECDCPYCDNKLVGFQSKDGDCGLSELEPEDVDNFYTLCDHCDTWVEYVVTKIEPLELELLKK